MDGKNLAGGQGPHVEMWPWAPSNLKTALSFVMPIFLFNVLTVEPFPCISCICPLGGVDVNSEVPERCRKKIEMTYFDDFRKIYPRNTECPFLARYK